LVAVIAGVIVARAWSPGPDLTLVEGYGGPLKRNFVTDPEVAQILDDRYGLEFNLVPLGSIDILMMACSGTLKDSDDFLWAGDQSTLDIYRENGGTMVSWSNIYTSPLVLYSWAPIVDALVAAGIAQLQPSGGYTVDFPLLVEDMMQGMTWAQIGLPQPQYYGQVLVRTSDPTRSNSGYLFAGLLATILNGGTVATPATVGPLVPLVADYFGRLGYMVSTTDDLFTQFMRDQTPIVAAYESQIMEFSRQNPSGQYQQMLKDVRILYPVPTVVATHPLIARTENGMSLLDALKDEDIQRLAWKRHGQRPGVLSVDFDPTATGVPGILKDIASVSMPVHDAMAPILVKIGQPVTCAATPVPTPLATTPVASLTELGRTGRYRGG
jgi:hypothetical protein